MRSQTKLIGEMLHNGPISNFLCIEHKITLRLAARIKDLRDMGWDIKTLRQKNKDTIYMLMSEPK